MIEFEEDEAAPDAEAEAVEAGLPVTDEIDPRPEWDIEFIAKGAMGVTSIHAEDADTARAAFLAKYPVSEQDSVQILSCEPG